MLVAGVEVVVGFGIAYTTNNNKTIPTAFDDIIMHRPRP
jgi:hypothetical protein